MINPFDRIAVICGGMSTEREVSLRSGRNCLEALHRLGYRNAFLLDMDRHIARHLMDERVDVAFLALHGRYGEDGCIQGMLEILGIPYTGNRVMASAITMDKAMTKTVLQAAGLPVLPSVTVTCQDKQWVYSGDMKALPFPVMVKPASVGSSVGMTKVDHLSSLDAALKTAAQHAATVLVEEFVSGQSLTVGVFQHKGQPVVTPILELRTKTGWYDYEAKYTQGLTDFILPADLPDNVTHAIQDTTLRAHQAAGCYGVSRTDFVMDAQQRFFILEINTIPGMTDLSDLPAQAQAMGIDYDTLVDCILQTACVSTMVPA
jgi:D-alanine-D-alanine ligase